jgi:thiosulfate/3-mercaptopyruvate sulfurtransferase
VLAALGDPGVARVDVRSQAEWTGQANSPAGLVPGLRTGRIPGARWIEWTDFLDTTSPVPLFLSPEMIRKRCLADGVTPGHEIHLYCYKGARASSSYVALREAGFPNVRLYLGSWLEWGANDTLPIEGSCR